MKILVCFGTRPEAIKMASVINELQTQKIEFKICVTAQHREMLDQVLDFFGITPNYDLNLMQPGQSLNCLSALILKEIDKILRQYRPDVVLVQGDTTTAFMVAMAAFNQKIKIGHIEAGLRTGNLGSPFPEEGNRQVISRIAHYHFAPTNSALSNLLNESISKEKITITGNTVIDALLIGKSKLIDGYSNKEIRGVQEMFSEHKKLILVTGHRRENFGKALENVCRALLVLAKRKDIQIVFPVHLNPTVKKTVSELLGNTSNIFLLDPVNYPAFIWLMMKANLIISDSGGVQEEAPTLKTPVIITRENTERPEGVEAGFSFLTGTSPPKIVDLATKLLEHPPAYQKKSNPFGDGNAAGLIVKKLTN